MRKLLLALLAMLPLSVKSHIFHVSKVRKGNQTIVLCSDYHNAQQAKNKHANLEQQDALIAYAKKKNALVIVEDAYCGNLQEIVQDTTASVVPTTCPVQENFIRANLSSPLNFLYTRCDLHAISSINVESRFSDFRTAANYIEYLINKQNTCENYQDPHYFKQGYTNALAIINEIINGPCKSLIGFLSTQKNLLKDALAHNRIPKVKNLDSILGTLTKEPWAFNAFSYTGRLVFLFMLYESLLMEIDILHEIAQHQDNQWILVIAGASHISSCQSFLKHAGYAPIASFGQEQIMNDSKTAFLEPNALDLIYTFDQLQTANTTPESFWSRLSHYIAWLLVTIGY